MTTLKITELKENPDNPRFIKEADFDKLVKSVRDFPEMLEARPIVVTPDYTVLGGNMRLRACVHAGLTEVPVHVATWEEAKQAEFIIKDNVSYGQWDYDLLGNEWQAEQLGEWGLNVWEADEIDYSALDDLDFDDKLDAMEGDVRRALQIPFEADDYEQAKELYKALTDKGVYVGELILKMMLEL